MEEKISVIFYHALIYDVDILVIKFYKPKILNFTVNESACNSRLTINNKY